VRILPSEVNTRMLLVGALALTGCPPPLKAGSDTSAAVVQPRVRWEPLGRFSRTRTPAGWIVHGGGAGRDSFVYVPDPEGVWLSEKPEAGK
jgi:hypothetical protein